MWSLLKIAFFRAPARSPFCYNAMTMIVVLEGVDASGKATQSKKLTETLRHNGIDAKLFDFPQYDSYSGRALKALLKREWLAASPRTEYYSSPTTTSSVRDDAMWSETKLEQNDEMTAIAIQALMTANRFEFFEMLKEWRDRTNGVLVLDRYYGSAIAYGEADGLDGEFLRKVHKILPTPDLWIFVDVPPEESVNRRPNRRDEYESREGFLGKVRERYLSLFADPPDASVWQIVDGVGAEDEVAARILALVQTYVVGPLVGSSP